MNDYRAKLENNLVKINGAFKHLMETKIGYDITFMKDEYEKLYPSFEACTFEMLDNCLEIFSPDTISNETLLAIFYIAYDNIFSHDWVNVLPSEVLELLAKTVNKKISIQNVYNQIFILIKHNITACPGMLYKNDEELSEPYPYFKPVPLMTRSPRSPKSLKGSVRRVSLPRPSFLSPVRSSPTTKSKQKTPTRRRSLFSWKKNFGKKLKRISYYY